MLQTFKGANHYDGGEGGGGGSGCFYRISFKINKQMVPCKSTAKEVSFEWSHHRISLTDSKVRTALNVSFIDSWSEKIRIKNM